MAHAALPFQQLVHEELPRRAHDASRNAVFQAMLAWGDAADERALASGTEGGGGFGPEVEVAPVSWDAVDGDGAGKGDGGGVAKVELTLSAA
eukprot:scaffold124737_cov33-Phaeocystis_antarctica.AAC.1